MNKGFHYAVDIDIKGFFDNVNHGKLLKQMWNLGIQDKNLLCIISKLLKAEIQGIGIPNKGTPQGGIISPLLSNIVLNELDWWVSNQWETFETRHNYSCIRKDTGKIDVSGKYKAMKKTNLKEMFIIRYADDFKILCKDYKTAQKVFISTKKWLKERLDLDISPEKSKVVNLRKNYSEFLGYRIKVRNKNKKYVVKSRISKKAKQKIISKIKSKVKDIKLNTNIESVNKYNSTILGIHNYYKYATHVSLDFKEIAYLVKKNIFNKTRSIRGDTGIIGRAYKKFYGQYNYKVYYIAKIAMFPIAGIKTKAPLNFSQEINNYTIEGRKKIHDKIQSINMNVLKYLMEKPVINESTEYNDNRISLFIGQKGLCGITGKVLNNSFMEVHHKKPKAKGGTDEYNNLIFVTTDIHKLIHATNPETIDKYINKIELDEIMLKKLNNLRRMVGNCVIEVNK